MSWVLSEADRVEGKGRESLTPSRPGHGEREGRESSGALHRSQGKSCLDSLSSPVALISSHIVPLQIPPLQDSRVFFSPTSTSLFFFLTLSTHELVAYYGSGTNLWGAAFLLWTQTKCVIQLWAGF